MNAKKMESATLMQAVQIPLEHSYVSVWLDLKAMEYLIVQVSLCQVTHGHW